MYPKDVQLFIDGQWVGGGAAQMPIVNPATGEAVASLACASASDLDRALGAAARAFKAWKVRTAADRFEVLSKAAALIDARKADIARVLTIENGKTLAEATGEVGFCADATRWYAEEGKRAYGRVIPSRHPAVRQTVLKEPVGPALGFAAWNFPAGNVTLKIAAALAAGCSIIVKPSDETPGTAAAVAQCFHDAGTPAGVLNLVYGEPAAISEHLIRSSIPKKVSLTGSTPVGKLLQKLASDTLKRCTMELGGHAPVLVFQDAELEKALDALVASKFRNAGQVCTSPTRFFVHEKVYEAFIDGFAQRVARIRLGDGLESTTTMGPLTLKRRLDVMDTFVRDATLNGASVITGGARLEGPGFFYAPTVLRDVPDSATIMLEEPFGPIVPIAPFKDFDEVLHRANALHLGLASYVFTQSGSIARRAGNELEAGQVAVNHTSVHEPETPFGGVNESGYGSESGIEGLDAYMRIKLVTEQFE
jgi:succinate-semialdehyde dehydrogenase/glutarate-semialdehyde dehydrogenase